MSKNQLYFFIIAGFMIGTCWIYFQVYPTGFINSFPIKGCLIKNVTNFPCPTCGTSRAIVYLFHGNFIQSILTNPLGIISLMLILISVSIVIYDLLFQRNTLVILFKKAETLLVKKYIYLPLIFLLIVNWIWNNYKNL